MTQFIELTLDWNRGAGWTPPADDGQPLPTDFAAEVPCTIGTEPARVDYARIVAEHQAAGIVVIASHTVGTGSPEAQADALAKRIGSKNTPIMLLPDPAAHPHALGDLLAVADAMTAVGLNPRIAYFPQFYAQAIGSPDLWGPLAQRGLALLAKPIALTPERYCGDDDAHMWAGYGGYRHGEIPLLTGTDWSFAAYRGSAADLAELLGYPRSVAGNTITAPPEPAAPAALPAAS